MVKRALRRGSHRPEDMRELGLELSAQILADIDHHRERAGKLLVVGNAGVDQDAIVEITRQEQGIALGGPGFLDEIDVGLGVEALHIAHST